MADPGFPVGGGMDLVRGAMDPRGGYVSKVLHVKMKESGPVGGGRAPPLDPPMRMLNYHLQIRIKEYSCSSLNSCREIAICTTTGVLKAKHDSYISTNRWEFCLLRQIHKIYRKGTLQVQFINLHTMHPIVSINNTAWISIVVDWQILTKGLKVKV